MIMSIKHYLLPRIRRQPATQLRALLPSRVWQTALIAIAPFAAYADLNLVPDMTPAQASAAAGTQRVYDTLRVRTTDESASLTADEQGLFDIARELVETSNEQQGSGPTQFSLGLTVDDLRNALQWVAAEELATPGTLATKTSSGQLASLAARFTAVRRGATGFRTSLLNDGGSRAWPRPIMLASAAEDGLSRGLLGDDPASSFSRLGGFFNVALGFGSKDPTAREDAFDYGNANMTLGVDYRATTRWVYGAALGYNRYEVDFDSGKSIVDGSVDSNGLTATLYGLYTLDAFSLDISANIGGNSFDIVRHIKYASNNPALPSTNETANGSTDSSQYSFSIGGNYEGHRDALAYALQAQVTTLNVTIDGYTESNAGAFNLQLEDQRITSLTSTLGVQASYTLNRSFGVLIPEASLQWHHEFNNDSRLVQARYVADPLASNFLAAPTEDPDRDYFSLGMGASAVFAQGLQVFVHYETLLGLSNITDHLLTGGARMEF